MHGVFCHVVMVLKFVILNGSRKNVCDEGNKQYQTDVWSTGKDDRSLIIQVSLQIIIYVC